MKIHVLQLHPYAIPLTNGQLRSGVFLQLSDLEGREGWGEIAPLPKWSRETLADCLKQFREIESQLMDIEWAAPTCLNELSRLALLPALSFGLESALLSLLAPLSEYSVPTSALLMGSVEEIRLLAQVKRKAGYTSAKLKVSHLTFDEAETLIHELKDTFRLRIDVNRAWSAANSLSFFAQFPLDTFDYVEEPFQNPRDLARFPHPLAIDESFPHDLLLHELASFPTLKALIYKPTIQGGLLGCLPLHKWASERNVSLVLSSSFETDLGLAHVASIAKRLSIPAPIGIGTYDYLSARVCAPPLRFDGPLVHIPPLYPAFNSPLQ